MQSHLAFATHFYTSRSRGGGEGVGGMQTMLHSVLWKWHKVENTFQICNPTVDLRLCITSCLLSDAGACDAYSQPGWQSVVQTKWFGLVGSRGADNGRTVWLKCLWCQWLCQQLRLADPKWRSAESPAGACHGFKQGSFDPFFFFFWMQLFFGGAHIRAGRFFKKKRRGEQCRRLESRTGATGMKGRRASMWEKKSEGLPFSFSFIFFCLLAPRTSTSVRPEVERRCLNLQKVQFLLVKGHKKREKNSF